MCFGLKNDSCRGKRKAQILQMKAWDLRGPSYVLAYWA